jgi:hypothetical protein
MLPPPPFLLFLLFRLLLFIRAIQLYAFNDGFEDEFRCGLFVVRSSEVLNFVLDFFAEVLVGGHAAKGV